MSICQNRYIAQPCESSQVPGQKWSYLILVGHRVNEQSPLYLIDTSVLIIRLLPDVEYVSG